MSIFRAQGLCKRYASFELDNVSFSLEKGKITGLVGRNGAGKSTLLKGILGFIRLDAGEILFFGKRFSGNEKEIKQRVGFVSDRLNFYSHQKLKQISNVTKSFYERWDDNAYQDYMKLFCLDETKTPAKLSAGMRVKYAVALALSHNAELLILDEPTSGLDPVSRDELREIFLSLCSRGKTILFSTHIISDLEKCADRLLYLKTGKLFADSELEDFVRSYRLVRFFEGDDLQTQTRGLIGCKKEKKGFSALIKAQQAEQMGLEGSPPDLETIMVHLEREGQICGI